jgi:hypothetical protein
VRTLEAPQIFHGNVIQTIHVIAQFNWAINDILRVFDNGDYLVFRPIALGDTLICWDEFDVITKDLHPDPLTPGPAVGTGCLRQPAFGFHAYTEYRSPNHSRFSDASPSSIEAISPLISTAPTRIPARIQKLRSVAQDATPAIATHTTSIAANIFGFKNAKRLISDTRIA